MAAGRTDFLLLGIACALGGIAIVTDLVWGRIFNWVTFPAIVLGLLTNAYLGGMSGALHALAGAGCGLFLFGWMFMLGFMGGGDVKLLMALGAFGGPDYAVHVALGSILVGGALALALMLFKGRLASFVARMRYFVMTLMVRELAVEKPEIDKKFTMPFGVPIAIAAIWIAWQHPFSEMWMTPGWL